MDIFHEILLSHFRHTQRTLFPLARMHLCKDQLNALGKQYKLANKKM